MEQKGNGVEKEKKNEVLRDLFEECLAHFIKAFSAQYPRGSTRAGDAKRPIAEFCGVGGPTVQRWMIGKSKLMGEQALRLMCFLDSQGYRVIELERMKPKHRGFFELIGYGLLSMEKASELLGYTSTSTLYEAMRGKINPAHDKEEKMWELWKEHRAELDSKKMEVVNVLDLYPVRRVAASKPEAAKPLSPTPTKTMAPRRRRAVVLLMEGLLMLLEEGSLSSLTEQELSELQRASGQVVLRLVGNLSALSSRLISSCPDGGAG